jgi:hypothetical protein
MTKKDYELIATELKNQHELLNYNSGVINGNLDGEPTITVYESSCRLWAQTLKSTNQKFDADRFLIACGVTQ